MGSHRASTRSASLDVSIVLVAGRSICKHQATILSGETTPSRGHVPAAIARKDSRFVKPPTSNQRSTTSLPPNAANGSLPFGAFRLARIFRYVSPGAILLVTLAALPLTGCDRAASSTPSQPPTADAARMQHAATVAAAAWTGLLTDIQQPGTDATWAFNLETADPAALRGLKYKVFPGPYLKMFDAGTIQLEGEQGPRFDLVEAGLRAADAAWLRTIEGLSSEVAARRLDRIDQLLAGVMRSAGRAEAVSLYKLTGVWRCQLLTRRAEHGPDAERPTTEARIAAIRAAITAEKLSEEVP